MYCISLHLVDRRNVGGAVAYCPLTIYSLVGYSEEEMKPIKLLPQQSHDTVRLDFTSELEFLNNLWGLGTE